MNDPGAEAAALAESNSATAQVLPFKKPSVDQRRKPAQATLAELFRQDLARSGLTVPNARAVGIELASTAEIWKLLHPKNPDMRKGFTVEGAVFPYYDPTGKRTGYARVRRLRGSWRTDDDGRQRYASPLNSIPHLYIPAPVCDWMPTPGEKIAVFDLTITEGEKKALKACLCGIPCVGLGGVDAYRSTRHHIALIDEFMWFDLTKTLVKVVYDSDVYQNPEVNRAIRALSDALRRDATPASLCQLRLTSESASSKTALDDFLAGFPTADTARRAFERLESREDPVSEAFATFNREITHVRRKTKYFNLATDTWYESQRKVTEEYARGKAVLDTDGKPFYPITKWFTERPPETEVLDVVYAPGRPERFRQSPDEVGEVLNTWRPGPLVATPYKRRAQVAEFLTFVEYLTPSLSDTERAWFLDWAAYPIKKVGAKVLSAVIIWSPHTGTGKNTFGRILRAFYGKANTYEMDGASLASNFNNWALHQFVIINEVDQPSYSERAAVMARLKTIITEERIDLERKFLPRENVPNYVNLYLTSNKHDALSLDEDDRRFFVVQAPDGDRKWSAEQFREFNAWLDTGGYERILGYLLKRDLTNFDPYAAPPRTGAWKEMLDGRSNPANELINLLITTPAVVLGVQVDGGRRYQEPAQKLYTPDQIVERLRGTAVARNLRVNLSVGILRSALGRHKVTKRALEFKRGPERRVITAYAFFEVQRWGDADNKAWRAHLVQHIPELSP